MSSDKQVLPMIRQMAIYDPRHLPEADFINSFVGRQQELQHLLQQIKRSAGENTHHLLIYGSRGMGKTSMLRRIALAIRDDKTLSQAWIPVNFREEQYNVRQLSVFWKNTADAMAEWCEQHDDRENAQLLDNAQDSHDDADTLWALLHKISQQHGARLLLLVDNLNLILQNLSEQDQWRLRKVLSQPDGPMMIAATSTLIKELTHRESPFYDYFQLQDLLPLSAAELRECLLRIARSRGALGEPVIKEINQQPARLQVLHTLTNSNPRTLFHIYQILESLSSQSDQSSQSFMTVLESLLDSVTPLYKARTEELTPQQRQVLDAIALAWDPKSSAWIAEQTELAASTLSPQLKRLRELGIIEEVLLSNNKKGLQLRERFYNIWYLLRNGSRRGRQRLRFFTCFLMDWYSPVERDKMARGYLKVGRAHLEYSLALSDAMDHRGLQRALVQQATLDVIQRNEVLDDILSQELDSVIMDNQQQHREVQQSLHKKDWQTEQVEQFWLALSGNLTLTVAERQQVINALDKTADAQLKELVADWGKQELPHGIFFTQPLITLLQEKQQQGLIRDYKDITGVLAVVEQTGNNAVLLLPLLSVPELALEEMPESYIVLALKVLFGQAESVADWYNLAGVLYIDLSRYQEAEQAYRKAIELDPKYANSWNSLGNLLQIKLARYSEAEQAYRQAIELDPKDAYPWNGLGYLLQHHLSRFNDAEKAYRQSIELDLKYADPWNNLGTLLQYHLPRYSEAEQAYHQAVKLNPKDAYPWNNLGNLLQDHLSRYSEAEQAYRQAIELDPQFPHPWNALGTLLQDHLLRYQEAEQAYLKASSLAKSSFSPVVNLCWLAIQEKQIEKAKNLYQNKKLEILDKPAKDLLAAALILVEDNFGNAWGALEQVLNEDDEQLWINYRNDLLRLVRLFKHYQYGERLLKAMQQAGFAQKLSPFYHALEASVRGEAVLKDINPEVRQVAETMFRWIESK